MTIIGLDIAQKTTGLAKIIPAPSPHADGHCCSVSWSTVTAEKGKGFYDDQERAAKTLAGVARWMDVTPQTQPSGGLLVVCEDFSFASAMPGTRAIGMVTGLIRYWLWKNRIPFALVSPMSLKKFICGHASTKTQKVSKEIVIRELYARFGHSVDDNNAADAVGLAYIGGALKGIWNPQNEAQRDVLKKLKIEDVKHA